MTVYYEDATVILHHGDALNLDIPDSSVDLIVTSPPYFGLRSYQDGGEHYAGQIGAEAGTTLLMAKALGRKGIGVDLSQDYCRLARWRTTDPGELARAMEVEKPPVEVNGQIDLFGEPS